VSHLQNVLERSDRAEFVADLERLRNMIGKDQGRYQATCHRLFETLKSI
jgi:hypothetical protein